MYQYTDWLPGAGPQKGNGTRQERVHSGGLTRSNSRISRAYMFGPEISGRDMVFVVSDSPMAPIGRHANPEICTLTHLV